MRIKRNIELDDTKWRVILEDNEIAFYYVKTVYPELTPMDIGFLHGDERDAPLLDPYESLDFIGFNTLKDLSPFRVKKAITQQVISMVKDLDFFYFQAASKELASIYSHLCKSIALALGKGWHYQFADGWFYFNKEAVQ